jgi:hypothetical protein
MQGLMWPNEFANLVRMIRTLKNAGMLCYRAGDNLVNNYGFEVAGYLTFLAVLALFP